MKTGKQEFDDEMDKFFILTSVEKYIAPSDKQLHMLANAMRVVNHTLLDIMETSGDIDDGDSYKAKITRKRGERVGKDKRRRR